MRSEQTVWSAPRRFRRYERFRRLLGHRFIVEILRRKPLLVGDVDDIFRRSSNDRTGGNGDLGGEGERTLGTFLDFLRSRPRSLQPLAGLLDHLFFLLALLRGTQVSTSKITRADALFHRSRPRILPAVHAATLYRGVQKSIRPSSRRIGPFFFLEHRQRDGEGSVRLLRRYRYPF